MNETFLKLQKEFERISKKGYIKGIYNNLSASGRTFENELGLPRNKESVPDYFGIEIKTRRTYSKSAITLFNAVPNGEKENELKRIKDNYGYPCKKDRNYKVLYAEIFGDRLTFGGAKYQYKLDVDRKNQKVYLGIYNKAGALIEKDAYWTFDYLKERLTTKLNFLAVINVWPKEIDHWNYFKYYKINFYVLKKFNTFIDMIETGKINLILKIGIYLDEDNYGKMYDHGCGFGLYEKDIKELFYKYSVNSHKLIQYELLHN